MSVLHEPDSEINTDTTKEHELRSENEIRAQSGISAREPLPAPSTSLRGRTILQNDDFAIADLDSNAVENGQVGALHEEKQSLVVRPASPSSISPSVRKTIGKTEDGFETSYLQPPVSLVQQQSLLVGGNTSSESLGVYPFSGNTMGGGSKISWRARAQSAWEENKGIVLMILAQFFGSAMAAIARLMETATDGGPPLNPFQILFARQSITTVLSLAYMWWSKVPDAPLGQTNLRPLLCGRAFGGFFGVVGLYFSLLYLPLADAIVITFLAPMLAAWVLSIVVKTPFTRTQQVAGLVAIFGVVLITQPFSLVTSISNSPDVASNATMTIRAEESTPDGRTDFHDPTPLQRAIGVACACIGICGAASAYVTISWIGKRAHPLISVTYFSTWCTLISILAMLFVPSVGFRLPNSVKEWTLLTGLGVSGFVMQFLLTASLSHKRSNKVLNVVYIQMLFALFFDKILFDETPTILSWLGSGFILGSIIWVAVKVEKKDETQKPEESSAPVIDEEVGLVSGMESEEDDSNADTRPRDSISVEMQSLRN